MEDTVKLAPAWVPAGNDVARCLSAQPVRSCVFSNCGSTIVVVGNLDITEEQRLAEQMSGSPLLRRDH